MAYIRQNVAPRTGLMVSIGGMAVALSTMALAFVLSCMPLLAASAIISVGSAALKVATQQHRHA